VQDLRRRVYPHKAGKLTLQRQVVRPKTFVSRPQLPACTQDRLPFCCRIGHRGLVEPTIGALTTGLCSTQARAMVAMGTPRDSAMRWTASRMALSLS
jgi:hypothetical protein